MCNQHHQVCRRIQGMQHSLKWMQCRHSEGSQIIALRSPPCLSKSKMKEIPSKYPSIEATPAKTLCYNKGNAFNPAYLHGNFDIDKDYVSRWMELAQTIPQLPWAQRNPDTYFGNMLHDPNNRIREQMAEPQQTTCRH